MLCSGRILWLWLMEEWWAASRSGEKKAGRRGLDLTSPIARVSLSSASSLFAARVPVNSTVGEVNV